MLYNNVHNIAFFDFVWKESENRRNGCNPKFHIEELNRLSVYTISDNMQ